MSPRPGDIAVIRTDGIIGLGIRVVTRSDYNHAGLFISPTQIIEAQPSGARLTEWSTYDHCQTIVGSVDLSDDERSRVFGVAQAYVGTPYGFLDILSVGLMQYGIKPRFVRDKVASGSGMICSQLVDQILLDVGYHLFKDKRYSQDVTPGDLAKRLGWR